MKIRGWKGAIEGVDVGRVWTYVKFSKCFKLNVKKNTTAIIFGGFIEPFCFLFVFSTYNLSTTAPEPSLLPCSPLCHDGHNLAL